VSQEPKLNPDEVNADQVNAGPETGPAEPPVSMEDVPVSEAVIEQVSLEKTAPQAEEPAGEEPAGEEPAVPAETLAAEAGARLRWAMIGAITLAVLLLASAALAVTLYFTSYRPAQLTDAAAQATVLDVAKSGAVAILSYSPETLESDLSDAKSRLTGDFLDYYIDFTDEAVRPAVQTKQVSTTANVARGAVTEMHANTAKVLLFINQATTSETLTTPSVAQSSILVTLDRVNGKWLISGFDPI